MNKSRLLVLTYVTVVLTLKVNTGHCQNNTNDNCKINILKEDTAYQNAKIKFASGITTKYRQIIYQNQTIIPSSKTYGITKDPIQLNKINKVSFSTKTRAKQGAIHGAIVGTVLLYLVKSWYEKDATDPIYGNRFVTGSGPYDPTHPHWERFIQKEGEDAVKLHPIAQVGIVAGTATLGTLIGHSIRSGWEIIFER